MEKLATNFTGSKTTENLETACRKT